MQNNSDKDLLLAILAIDSYNQGYAPGLRQFNVHEIGEATVDFELGNISENYGDSLLNALIKLP